MTKADNISLYNVLSDKKLQSLTGVKFAYAVSKNLSLLQPEIDALKKALESKEDYNKYEEARIELAKKHAKKDEKGKEVTTLGKNGQEEYVMEDMSIFEKAFKALKEEHKEAIDARDEQIKEQNELLKTDSTIELHKVSLSDVPQDITVGQMQGISAMVTDDIISPLSS
jgi:Fe2+ transport system protein B